MKPVRESNPIPELNPIPMLNRRALELFESCGRSGDRYRVVRHTVAAATVLDFGTGTPGSLAAGRCLARLCLGDAAEVDLLPADRARFVSPDAVVVRTDDPVRACLGGQYAGWPVKHDDYFAMGSGPMRMARGREPMLDELSLRESAADVVGVLESETLPTDGVIETVAGDCGVAPDRVHLAVAPSTSIAGSFQVVARSIETALHKLHAVGFPVAAVLSATGFAPLPPPAKPGDTIGGIGRTNDAVLYGGQVTLWVDAEDDAIADVAERVPSRDSADHGRPFAEVFRDYDYDFYRVDPLLFSPAVVTIHNLRSGRSWTAGEIETDVLRRSFLT